VESVCDEVGEFDLGVRGQKTRNVMLNEKEL
jgi:hypothetical protein